MTSQLDLLVEASSFTRSWQPCLWCRQDRSDHQRLSSPAGGSAALPRCFPTLDCHSPRA